ncbi:6-hydroxy-D-nicotine oxidase [Cytospora mali]|uniref:6-hydroxy-D-nicotine oxidase n=1 Tax=Cytospora mali TaxID=578113 RepID=A0A194UNA7_CYTMA|nr:6-hydroxy-D-nicotine oxidase [Valsa mali var. pyri (nom. inval.)]
MEVHLSAMGHRRSTATLTALLNGTLGAFAAATATYDVRSNTSSQCRYLPGDAQWPGEAAWAQLNVTVGGRLVAGKPLGQSCFEADFNVTKCDAIKSEWTDVQPYITDPVNIMSPYWVNNSCNPFFGPNSTCTLGDLANYAIRVEDPQDAAAGVNFAQKKNIRLTIKNTGHDVLGRSGGKGSLGLWTHNLKNITFLEYSSPNYTGPAARLGAGVEYSDVQQIASKNGLRVLGGSCPTVGIVGGFTQGGGHGPLAAAYGLGADQVLEWEVVTADGQHTTASPAQNPDLFWAMRGGGPGNYAVALSVTVKAYSDGPVAGAGFRLVKDIDNSYWEAISAFLRYLLVLDTIKGYMSGFTITATAFELGFTLRPDATSAENATAPLAPLMAELDALNVTLTNYTAILSDNYADWFDTWAARLTSATNVGGGGRLIPRAAVRDNLTAVVGVLRDIIENSTEVGGIGISGLAVNVTEARVGPAAAPGASAVLPAWRDALFQLIFAYRIATDADWDTLSTGQAFANEKQDELRAVTPGGGAYMNEATWDNPNWKEDYFGSNYARLLAIKAEYDPNNLFWAEAAVGSDVSWVIAADGRLCKP